MRRLKLQRKKAAIYVVLFISTYLFYNHCLPIYLDIKNLLDEDSCPACYGTNLCNEFHSDNFELEGYQKFTAGRLINERNVYYAWWRGKNVSVVLKKLITDRELAQFDRQLCEGELLSTGGTSSNAGCNVGEIISRLTEKLTMQKSDLKGLESGELTPMTLNLQKLTSMAGLSSMDLMQCSHSQDKIDLLVRKCLHHQAAPYLAQVVSLLLVNPEPVIASMFPKSAGWPFPEYFGSCGRMAVMEYIGPTVGSYINSSWLLRAFLALQLLEMARKLSHNHEGIALYPTDWTASNFAVEPTSGKVYLVDLEHIIVVNQTYLREVKSPGWDTPHTADRFGCDSCFSFSAEDLCSHVNADHNYHGVCGGLLAKSPYSPGLRGGLLHGTPRRVIERHPLILRLVQQCWETSTPGGREEAANLLIEILKTELAHVKFSDLTSKSERREV